jgi:hypothetical protein
MAHPLACLPAKNEMLKLGWIILGQGTSAVPKDGLRRRMLRERISGQSIPKVGTFMAMSAIIPFASSIHVDESVCKLAADLMAGLMMGKAPFATKLIPERLGQVRQLGEAT